MSRTSYLAITWSRACVLLFLFATNTTAAELKGTVTALHDGEVKVDYVPDEKVAPAKGDAVTFSDIIPESEISLPSGTGTIKEIGEGFVWVTVVSMTPRLHDTAIIEATGVVLAKKLPSFKDLFPPGQEGENYAVPRKRGRLGAQFRPLTPEEAEAKGLSGPGIFIEKTVQDSAAEQAGLLVGDIIREVNGTSVEGGASFVVTMLLQSPGAPVDLQIWRDGTLLSKRVTLGEGLVPDTVLQFNLSWMYWSGEGVSEDHAESIRLLRLAADGGDAQAQYGMARRYAEGVGVEKDMSAAARSYRLAANQGHALAQFFLGVMYERGDGVSKDGQEAARLYRLAADQGIPGAQYNFANMSLEGNGVEKDVTLAARYFLLAADQGHAESQFHLAVMHENGDGVPKDMREAIRYYQLSADQGYAGAQNNLGVRYNRGQGVKKDQKMAIRYFKLAADQGDPDAHFNLGLSYEYGKGIPKDVEEAVRLYKKAATQGHQGAAKQLQQLGR